MLTLWAVGTCLRSTCWVTVESRWEGKDLISSFPREWLWKWAYQLAHYFNQVVSPLLDTLLQAGARQKYYRHEFITPLTAAEIEWEATDGQTICMQEVWTPGVLFPGGAHSHCRVAQRNLMGQHWPTRPPIIPTLGGGVMLGEQILGDSVFDPSWPLVDLLEPSVGRLRQNWEVLLLLAIWAGIHFWVVIPCLREGGISFAWAICFS